MALWFIGTMVQQLWFKGFIYKSNNYSGWGYDPCITWGTQPCCIDISDSLKGRAKELARVAEEHDS